jgi:hypothetical protein
MVVVVVVLLVVMVGLHDNEWCLTTWEGRPGKRRKVGVGRKIGGKTKQARKVEVNPVTTNWTTKVETTEVKGSTSTNQRFSLFFAPFFLTPFRLEGGRR